MSKKIMFKDKYGLTRAVLERKKTQTRRLVPKDFFTLAWDKREDTLVYENDNGDFIDIRDSKYAIFKVGEIVAIAQRYSEIVIEPFPFCENGWHNKMFVKPNLMPHHIKINDVKVERLQDISDETSIKEGIRDYSTPNEKRYGYPDFMREEIVPFRTPREAFASLIDKVSGKGTWESNPYVFVYDFELID
jgi:hypothetical protein|nr:MAG TPA: ASCH domain protein [Caudoviricetes sp.]